MTEAAKDQDQSMEDILQSIKRIIAEEGEPAPAEDVLELMDMVAEERAAEPVHLQPMDDEPTHDLAGLTMDEIMAGTSGKIKGGMIPEPAEMPPVLTKMIDDIVTTVQPEEPIVAAPKEAPIIAAPPPPVEAPVVEEPLISDTTFATASAALNTLKAAAVDHTFIHSPSFRSGTTVEDLVLESLRPMLREWLDENLTETIERLVERELRKISAR